jgi:CDGSH-type Zn-finger protein
MTAHDTPAVILAPCPDGPILVRGDVEIRDTAGRVVPRRRATVALCRCGASGIKPFCDGSHKAVGFRTDDEAPRPDEPVAAPGRSVP